MIWNGAEAMRNAHDLTHFPFANSLKSLNFKNMNTLIISLSDFVCLFNQFYQIFVFLTFGQITLELLQPVI